MSSSLNIQLTDELRRFVDERAGDDDIYATPSEYVRDLIRRDMELRSKSRAVEIATMLMEARQTLITPIAQDFPGSEKKLMRRRIAARQNKRS